MEGRLAQIGLKNTIGLSIALKRIRPFAFIVDFLIQQKILLVKT